MMQTIHRGLPLSALLSHLLVAFTIEFDNEAEHRLAHRTTNHGASSGPLPKPWLVSMVMWFNCMRFVHDRGISVRALEELAGTPTNLAGMERWGYVAVTPDPADKRPKPPRSSWLIVAKAGGRRAQEVWRPLFEEIEGRWRQRFSDARLDELGRTLTAVAEQFDVAWPDCLPILRYGLTSQVRVRRSPGRVAAPELLPALLARLLLAYAVAFESKSEVSLAIGANLFRLLDRDFVAVRELPRLAGVSKEAVAMALSFLVKRGLAVMSSGASRVKQISLTDRGRRALDEYQRLVWSIETDWEKQFGSTCLRDLRETMESFVGDSANAKSPLFLGLEPYPDGWRAAVPRPSGLPHFPMTLHRGGFPDGS